MHSFTPSQNQGPNGMEYRLEAKVQSDTIRAVRTIATVEGRSATDIVAKTVTLFDFLSDQTQRSSSKLYFTPSAGIFEPGHIGTPRQFAREMGDKIQEPTSRLALSLSERTKTAVDKQLESFREFNSFFTTAVSYYGLLASHLYAGEELYVRNIFESRVASRLIILE